jgi:hypothetical protein
MGRLPSSHEWYLIRQCHCRGSGLLLEPQVVLEIEETEQHYHGAVLVLAELQAEFERIEEPHSYYLSKDPSPVSQLTVWKNSELHIAMKSSVTTLDLGLKCPPASVLGSRLAMARRAMLREVACVLDVAETQVIVTQRKAMRLGVGLCVNEA